MTSDSRKSIYLETSSYLPLIWRTPYSQSLVTLMAKFRQEGANFYLQKDCILEAAGYFSFKDDDWRYHPAVRIRRLVERRGDEELAAFGYPSAAVQLLLGGNIWPQAQYLNFVRHMAFFCADLLDGISWENPRQGLLEFAERIEKRLSDFQDLLASHAKASELRLPDPDVMLPYWGPWHLPRLPTPFTIQILPDPRPYNMTTDKLRDIYHYDCAIYSTPRPDIVLVANTRFTENVKSSFAKLPCRILCAETDSASVFG